MLPNQLHQCRDCGATEGHMHQSGCGVERCPFCGWQLVACGCAYTALCLVDARRYGPETAHLPPETYANGLTEEQAGLWQYLLEAKGLVPYIVYPVLCARCGTLWPELFAVPDEEWARYVQLNQRHKVLCLGCWTEIKGLIDGASGGT